MARLIGWVALSFILFAVGIIVLSRAATEALAQEPQCGPTETIIAGLHEKYGETELDAIPSPDGRTLYWMAGNAQTGTWTALVSDVNGLTCMVMTGNGLKLPPPIPEAET